MTSEEIEGRLAALETAAAIAIQGWGREMFASAYGSYAHPVRDWIIEGINQGAIPSPNSDQGKAAMIDALSRIFTKDEFPPIDELRDLNRDA